MKIPVTGDPATDEIVMRVAIAAHHAAERAKRLRSRVEAVDWRRWLRLQKRALLAKMQAVRRRVGA